MAEAIVSVILEQLASILVEQVEAKVKLVVGVEEEVQKLTSNFMAIKAVLEDAENRQVKEIAVRDWLDKLKDTSYDIQDVLDKWNTAIRTLHMKKIEDASVIKKKVRSLIPAYRFSPKQVVLRREIGTKIKSLNKTLDNLSREKDMFNFSLTKSTRELEQQITSSVIDLSKIHGRDQEKNKIVDFLLCESSQGVASLPIISIVGMGGIGKTTLARLVYHDNRVNNHFDKKIWVCVSDPFDEIRIARAILESLEQPTQKLVELEAILQRVAQIVRTKKFLLVLDDVWTEDGNKWEQLRDSLKSDFQESRILLTTRKDTVAKIMGSTNTIFVGKLPEEECWSLFSQVAFSGRTKQQCVELEDIGKKILRKCNGLPLAVKTLGSLLCLKTRIEQWQNVLDSELWRLEEIEKVIFPPLLLSYYDLSSNLRKCFSYCAIFPKNHLIIKDELIKLWMAQGYLKIEGREDMELVGEEYFENLAMRSFFQDFETNEEGNEIRSCKMHDIVHDFAQYLTKNECFAVEVNDPALSHRLEFASHKARHSMILLLRSGSFSIAVSSGMKLRSLVIRCFDDLLTSDILTELFDKMSCLRAIDLDTYALRDMLNIKEVPKGIRKLIHLRYLSLKMSNIKELPEALCSLYNLQTLDISFCVSLEKLPQGLRKLINLRHLINPVTPLLQYMPKGMDRLTSLRTLSKFVVSGKWYGRKASTLECLKNFNYLRGSLDINGLGNVTDVGEVKNADLKRQRNLLHLSLSFDEKEEGEGKLNVEDGVVLEALQPHQNLQKLKIRDYKSNTIATHWIVSLTNLKMLDLRNCNNLRHLPSLGTLPSLESLSIDNMKNVRNVGSEFLGTPRDDTSVVAFPKLKSLAFDTLDNWEKWDYEFWGVGGERIVIMPSLCSLKLKDCPKLLGLPDHLLQTTTLEELVFDGCTNLGKRYQEGIGEDWEKVSHIRIVQIVTKAYTPWAPTDDSDEYNRFESYE